MLDVAFFRYLPHFAKSFVYNDQSWLLSNLLVEKTIGSFPAGKHRDSIEFVMKMSRRAVSGCDKHTFKYIHISPPHYPIIINEQIEYEEFQEHSIVIPKDCIGANGIAELMFILPDAASPASLSAGEDVRTLGIAMHSIVLSKTGTDQD